LTSRSSAWTTYGVPLLFIAASILTILALAGRPGAASTDFLTFYQSSRQFLAGTDPYVPYVAHRGPNLNPPWVVAIMAQLCRAPLPAALIAWWAISFVCLFASVHLISKGVAPRQGLPIACAVLVTQAAFSNVRLGQVAWPVMLLVTSAWLADRAGRSTMSGILIGLAASWKPFLLVFVPYLLWRRAWRSLAAMIAAAACALGVGFAALGPAGHRSWLESLRLVGWEGHPLNASVRGLLTRALTSSALVDLHSTPIVVAPSWRDPVWFLTAGAMIAATFWRVITTRSVDVAWASLCLLALLVSPLGWVHYVSIATGPLVALMVESPSVSRVAVVGWLLLCVPFLWLKEQTFGPFLTVTLASSYCWGTMMLLAAALMAESPRRAGRKYAGPVLD
jgi:alpha-1,2-mannosyltransferase